MHFLLTFDVFDAPTGVTASDVDPATERDAAMRVHVKPRLQQEKWSLYWKTSMATRTLVGPNSTWRLNTTRRRRRRCEIVREILWWSDVLTHRAGESESGGADRVTSGVVVASLGGVCRTVGIDVRCDSDATAKKRSSVSRRGD